MIRSWGGRLRSLRICAVHEFHLNITFNNHQAVKKLPYRSNERPTEPIRSLTEAEQYYSFTAKFEYYNAPMGDLYVSTKFRIRLSAGIIPSAWKK
jgi:hypothetical protein